jgi:hypothetical protein
MQRFIAELSNPMDQCQVEVAWKSCSGTHRSGNIVFDVRGPRVTIVIDSKVDERWPTDDFYRTFTKAVRGLDKHCNIRWL